jgi:hypothetical protein
MTAAATKPSPNGHQPPDLARTPKATTALLRAGARFEAEPGAYLAAFFFAAEADEGITPQAIRAPPPPSGLGVSL